jgi:putative endonuclease
MAFFVYLVECRDKTYYCGCTKSIKARLAAHNKGIASKYTRARRPVKLVYLEQKKSRQEALKREAQIKTMNRKQKEELIGCGGQTQEK